MRFAKRFILILLSSLLLLAVIPAAAQADDGDERQLPPGAVQLPRTGDYVLRIDGGYTDAHMETVAGQSCLRVDLYLDGVTADRKLSSISFKLVYDAEQLTYVQYRRFSGTGLNDAANPNTPGQFNFALTSTNGSQLNSTTPLVSLFFTLNEGVGSGSQIRFGFSEPIQSSYLKPNYTSQLCSTGAQLKPFGVGTVWGDANCDCDVTAADASLVLRAVVGLTSLTGRGLTNAKVSGQTTLCTEDAVLILRYAVGLIEQFPAEG